MNRFFTLLFAASCLTAVGQVPDYVPTDGLVGWLPLNGDFAGWSVQNVSWDVSLTSVRSRNCEFRPSDTPRYIVHCDEEA